MIALLAPLLAIALHLPELARVTSLSDALYAIHPGGLSRYRRGSLDERFPGRFRIKLFHLDLGLAAELRVSPG